MRSASKSIPFILFVCSALILPVLSLDASQTIFSTGEIVYYQPMSHELGVYYVWNPSTASMPYEAEWAFVGTPNAQPNKPDLRMILSWLESTQPGRHHTTPISTAEQLNIHENNLKTVPTENFWGIYAVHAEFVKQHIAFNEDLNTTWFGETLLGYQLYLQENPSATQDQWKDEMYLRMLRGFYDYFHARGVKVGYTMGAYVSIKISNIQSYLGWPAFNYMRENFDFMELYAYTHNLGPADGRSWNGEAEDWPEGGVNNYFSVIDQYFSSQQLFWCLTRRWNDEATWEWEAMALEIKNALDREMVICPYYSNDPPLSEQWPVILNALDLYDQNAQYYEEYVYGENLLTGYAGETYGWVEIS